MNLGIDVGSVTVKAVLLDEEYNLLEEYYRRSKGSPISALVEILDDLFSSVDPSNVRSLGTAGSGGELFARVMGGDHTNELVAQGETVGRYYPKARTVIEIGGQDSKLLILNDRRGKVEITDFALNNQCSAGTGSFLDQQAERLGYSIQEFSELALESDDPPRIAGRCSVFAKSDIIHLQQVGTSEPDIINGLCYAVARNFVGDIGRGKRFKSPIVFQGGVSRNQGMERAFRDLLNLEDGELIIPDHEVLMTAIGTAILADENKKKGIDWPLAKKKLEEIARKKEKTPIRDPLELEDGRYDKFELEWLDGPSAGDGDGGRVFMGIDVGSISTNIVTIDRKRGLFEKVYLKTKGKPIQAVQTGLREMRGKLGPSEEVSGVCVTGSGREMIAGLVSADLTKNEISSQARATTEMSDEVETVFEIGGQDSKYISLDGGTVVDFAMNKACAAGTGSFLEEQAKRLEIDLEEFGEIALNSQSPVDLGERCTVFMESDLVHCQQRGANKKDLVAGLASSIAINYLNRVVGDKEIGDKISFQGGVASNKAVLAAFSNLLPDKEIFVPSNHEVTGASGAALVAEEEMEGKEEDSSFAGFSFSDLDYKLSSFVCEDCSNRCEIKKVKLSDRPALFYGSRCGKYDSESRRDEGKKEGTQASPINLFELRNGKLWGEGDAFLDDKEFKVKIYPSYERKSSGIVGIPKALLFWEKFPFWSEFFRELGYDVVLSGESDKRVIKDSVREATAETCLPSKLTHGHIDRLVSYGEEGPGLDYLFLPNMVSNEFPESSTKTNFNCPLVQGLPYISDGHFDFSRGDFKFTVLSNPFHFYREKELKKDLKKLGDHMGVKKREVMRAYKEGNRAQLRFKEECKRAGKKILENLTPERPGIVIISRAYNGCDPGLNLDIPKKLRELGAQPVPIDFLPLGTVDSDELHPSMQWDWGKRILSGAKIIKARENLHGLYLSHFRCGPDSFLVRYVKRILADEPLLQVELDEHSADAGIRTRCEAFLDSLDLPKERDEDE